MSKIQVYRIYTYPAKNNHHGIDRDENWFLRRDKTFDTKEEATEYIISQSRTHTDMILYSYNLPPKEKEAFYQEFCFTNNTYASYRRYILDLREKEVICRALQKNGIKLIKA